MIMTEWLPLPRHKVPQALFSQTHLFPQWHDIPDVNARPPIVCFLLSAIEFKTNSFKGGSYVIGVWTLNVILVVYFIVSCIIILHVILLCNQII